MNMNRICLTVCLILLFTPLLAHAEEPVQYEIEAKFIAYPTNDMAAGTSAIKTLLLNLNKFNLMTVYNLNLGALPANWSVLSAPRVTTVAGKKAQICILKDPPQYFERQSDGSFQLRQMGDKYSLGITLTVTTTAGTTDQIVKLDAQVKYNSIQQREQLPGVSLDVGKPTIRTLERRFDLETVFGNSNSVLGSLSGF